MPRNTRTAADRKQAEMAQRARERRLQKLKEQLRKEWCLGQTAPTDLLASVREAEQERLARKRRRAERREQARRRRLERRQAR